MKVYYVECGCLDDRSVAGVYSSLALAMAAHPIPVNAKISSPGGWRIDGDTSSWWNGCGWESREVITEVDLIGTKGEELDAASQ